MGARSASGSKKSLEELFEAVDDNDLGKVRTLLAAGVDPNGLHEEYDTTMLQSAVGPLGSDDVAAALVEAGANPRQADDYGFTPLHYAAHLDKPRACEALLRAGADPNAVSSARSPSFEGMVKGATALRVAEDAAIKKLLAGVTTVGLATSAFAKKIERLRAWYSRAHDFEGGEPDLDALAGFEAEGYLMALGQSGNGSVFALWSKRKLAEPKDGPVVYLDSEGEPYCAVATSLDEFLSVLAHGTGWIYDAASGKAPAPKQALAAVAAALEAEEDEDGRPVLAGKRYATWWKGMFGVAPAKDPVAIVTAAKEAKPTLQTWLRKKSA